MRMQLVGRKDISDYETKSGEREIMHRHELSNPVEVEREKSFIAIQVRGGGGGAEEELRVASPLRAVDFTPMKLFHRLRKVLMRLIFALPSSSGRGPKSAAGGGDGSSSSSTDQPKTSSCSSYYTSSNSHYSEAIADCIEFFNKSSEGILLDHQKTSDAHVVTIV